MKTVLTIIVAMFVVVGFGATPAIAATCTFDPDGDTGIWNEPLNWDDCDGDFPKVGDSATILADQTCTIGDSDETCDSVDVQTDGRLKIKWGGSLTISENSTVDGVLSVSLNATLFIGAPVKISGEGGEIVMGENSLIDESAAGAYILFEPGDPNCTGENLQRSCAIVLRGYGTINVELRNYAFVVAQPPAPGAGSGGCSPSSHHLVLADKTKKGNGYWIAEYNGVLEVNTRVEGSGTWQIADTESYCAEAATIQINACYAGAGPVELRNGFFEVNERFCTTGDLTWASTGSGSGTSPTIKVADGKFTSFGTTLILTCPP